MTPVDKKRDHRVRLRRRPVTTSAWEAAESRAKEGKCDCSSVAISAAASALGILATIAAASTYGS
jgi:hypothetical protein